MRFALSSRARSLRDRLNTLGGWTRLWVALTIAWLIIVSASTSQSWPTDGIAEYTLNGVGGQTVTNVPIWTTEAELHRRITLYERKRTREAEEFAVFPVSTHGTDLRL